MKCSFNSDLAGAFRRHLASLDIQVKPPQPLLSNMAIDRSKHRFSLISNTRSDSLRWSDRFITIKFGI